jgi:hypothetical protein
LDDSKQFYAPTNDFAVLGCTEQYQFCEPQSQKCTDLGGIYAVQKAIKRGDLTLSDRQQAIFSIMWEAAWGIAWQWTIKLLKSRVLLAQDWVFTVVASGSSALPPKQWQQESFNLHNLSLALFQHRVNQYSSPDRFEVSPGKRADDHLDTPTDPNMLALCRRQRVLSAQHYSVSVLGMALILSIGSILILLDQSLETLWFQFFNPQSRLAKRAEWTQTGTLQLHRQALEARSIGPWDRKNQEFPILDSKDKAFTGLGAREEMIGETQDDAKAQYHIVTDEVPLKRLGSR